MQLHLIDADAGAVVIEHVLHQLLHGLLGLLARLRQERLNVGLADHLAHGALGHLLYGDLGVLDVEEIMLRVLDAPEHDEVDIDDVLVAGQHQAFLGHVAHAAGKAARGHARAHADLDDVLPRHLRQAHLLDRIGQAEVQARRLLRVGLPKRMTTPSSSALTRKVKA